MGKAETRQAEKEMSKLNVKYMNRDKLIPYANNARTHSEHQIKQIAASIQEFGFTNPVLIDEDNGIIAGHGRLEAAEILDLTDIPTIKLSGLSDAQKRAYVIADNKLAMNAGWDAELLKLELTQLSDEDFKLELLGFDIGEIEHILSFEADPSAEIVPDAPPVPVSRLGDIWALGKHRLICGDATEADTVARLLDGVEPHLMVTDPPYGVAYDANWRNEALTSADRATGNVANDQNADWREAWALFPGDVAYVWHADNKGHIVAESLLESGFEIRSQIIWAKNNIVIGRGHYHPKHEPCWYAVRGKGHWSGSRKESTVWNIDKPQKSETGHSTQKPVECMMRPMINNSSPGQAVYDPFMGSGTSIIAAEKSGRISYGIELEPSYVDICVLRWQDYTGKTAKHAETGKPFVPNH